MGRKPAPQPLVLSRDGTLLKSFGTSPAAEQFASSTLSPTLSISSPNRYGNKNDIVQALAPARIQPSSSPRARLQNDQQPFLVADLVQQSPRYPESPSLFLPVLTTTVDNPPNLEHPKTPQQYGRERPQRKHTQPQSQLARHSALGRNKPNDDKFIKSSSFFSHFGKPPSVAKSTEKLTHSNIAPSDLSASRPTDKHDKSSSRGSRLPSPKDVFKSADHNAHQRIAPSESGDLPLRSDAFPTTSMTEADSPSANTPLRNKGKQKVFLRRGRTRSIEENECASLRLLVSSSSIDFINGATSPGLQGLQGPQGAAGGQMRAAEQPDRIYQSSPSLTTAPPAQHDRSFREMMTSSNRNHSADRLPSRDVPNNRDNHFRHGHGHTHREQERDSSRVQPLSLRDSSGTFFNGLKNSSRSAAGIISKGLFGKNGRNGAVAEREPIVDDEHYVLKVINQPLLEQTRLTRISKRLEDSRDRTEFWMPAFPWRAIDYLNYKGTDVEGLYRVPGSGPQIKKWQRKFDEEYDVDLFTQHDLYDINIIGSMLKAWLRELPDELFPKEAQERIARECAGAETVPQMLVDELSNLPPFNYYLLFAITCHLSLLLAHSDRNKMDFRNLCICFQPCMKIDAFSFKFLVCDWRDCWKGCINEPRYIEEEYKLFHMPPPQGIGAASHDDDDVHFDIELDYAKRPPLAHTASSNSGNGSKSWTRDETTVERQVSSSGRKAQNGSSSNNDEKPRLKKKPVAVDVASVASDDTLSTTLTIESLRVTTPPRQSGDLRPLSPIKPLSPMGF